MDKRLRFLVTVFLLWLLLVIGVSFVLQNPKLHVDAVPDPAKMPGKRHEKDPR